MTHVEGGRGEKPPSETEEALAGEVARLRRAVQDMAALSALPALWTAPNFPHGAESLADALLSTLDLDFVLIGQRASLGGVIVKAVRAARQSGTADPVMAISQALAPWLNCDNFCLPGAIPDPLGSGTVWVASAPIGPAAELGMLVGGSHRSDFPTETEQLLLRVGAHQATVLLTRSDVEKALDKSEERLRLITAGARCILWDADVVERDNGTLAWDLKVWNEEAARRFLPIPMIEGAGFVPSWYESRIPEDKERMDRYGPTELQAGRSYYQEFRCRMADGSIRWLAEDVTVEPVAPGRWQAVGVCTDITERTKAEEALQQSKEGIEQQREDLQSLIMQSPVPICVFKGPELVYDRANAAYLEVVGGRDILGRPLLDALPELQGQGFDEVLRGVMQAGEPVVGREALIMLEREGRLQEAYWTFIFSPLRDSDGTVNRVVALCDDVTDQKRLMNELIESDRRKDEFLATLAHELRNPLAPLRSSVQLLRCEALPSPMMQRSTDVIDRQVQQLVRLVDDLLDVSRITLDKLELRKERVTLAMVVQAAIEASRPLIDQCGHDLTVTLPPEPIDLDADLTRLAQVFLNLLNNAAKYTERGGRIWLAAEREGEHVVVRVRDSGMGIAADMLPRVFEMFMQAHRSLDQSQGGLGIGLTLVKRLVQMHGGVIEARSEGPGKGSEFIVRLPVLSGVQASGLSGVRDGSGSDLECLNARMPEHTARHRILVVDDNRDAAGTLAELLALTGHDLRTAHDGVEAVQLAAEFRPDVVLLDIGLPRMNGYEVARKIREQAWGEGMVLVALTGWGQEEDRRRSGDAGFDHHIVKPVELDALLELLTSLTE
jgi:signal transduction histidine kinase/ActR/RegA family two-component response regulator